MSHTEPYFSGQEASNSLLPNNRCCFCFPCFSSRRSSPVGFSWWERVRSKSQTHHPSEDRWWARGVRALKKLREWSEIVAGPKWKTFIRRFNRNGSGGRNAKYQYDPLSYALNFDEGPGGKIEDLVSDDYNGFRNFSTRYASVPHKSGSPGSGKAVAAFA